MNEINQKNICIEVFPSIILASTAISFVLNLLWHPTVLQFSICLSILLIRFVFASVSYLSGWYLPQHILLIGALLSWCSLLIHLVSVSPSYSSVSIFFSIALISWYIFDSTSYASGWHFPQHILLISAYQFGIFLIILLIIMVFASAQFVIGLRSQNLILQFGIYLSIL